MSRDGMIFGESLQIARGNSLCGHIVRRRIPAQRACDDPTPYATLRICDRIAIDAFLRSLPIRAIIMS
jgi:hypothetical protein